MVLFAPKAWNESNSIPVAPGAAISEDSNTHISWRAH